MHAADLGDHIGMESCVDLEIDTAPPLTDSAPPLNRKPWGISRKSSSISGTKPKELPPPMPIHTSTVMKRYYTDDGRLVITEEKVESPKYVFTANRSNGRLTLQLAPSELTIIDAVEISKSSSSLNNSSEEEEEGMIIDDEFSSGVDKVVAIGDVDGGNRGKCCGYSTAAVRVAAAAASSGGSCLFVDRNREFQAIRPVQI